jgi:hypothetical protein
VSIFALDTYFRFLCWTANGLCWVFEGLKYGMVVTAKELAGDSEGVLSRVVERGERALIQRDGKIVAQIVRAEGVSRVELIAALSHARWTREESAEMKRAADVCTEVVGYAGSD